MPRGLRWKDRERGVWGGALPPEPPTRPPPLYPKFPPPIFAPPYEAPGTAIRPGNIIEHQGRLWRAVKIMHTQPGKGGAYLQVELKDIRDGTKLNERFRSSETVERVRLDQHDYQYLFNDGDGYTFMDTDTFDQVRWAPT